MKARATKANDTKHQYTPYPFASWCSTEYENRAVAPAGPTARVKLMTDWAIPLVAPSKLGEGQAAAI